VLVERARSSREGGYAYTLARLNENMEAVTLYASNVSARPPKRWIDSVHALLSNALYL
jgi:hypothetical protein